MIQARIDAKATSASLDALSSEERVVYLALWTKGVVDVSGFQYFFHSSYSLAEAGRAYATLGLDDLAASCQCVVRLVFPDGVPSDTRARVERVQKAENSIQTELHRFWLTPFETVQQAVASYIRANPDAFAVPPPCA
jgi:hypothetical protein